MSDNDPLSDPLSHSSDTQEATAPSSSGVEARKSRSSDLFAAPFQSSIWNEQPSGNDNVNDNKEEVHVTMNAGNEKTKSLSTSLDALAPVFVPSFSPTSPTSTSNHTPTTPLDIVPSPPAAEASEPEQDPLLDATPQASRPSPLSLAAKESPETNSVPAETQENTTEQHQPEPKEDQQVSARNSLTLSIDVPPALPRSPSSSTSTYSPSTLRNLITQSCQSGDLPRLRFLFAQHPDSNELFTLSNSINPTTGFAPIHHAAKKGHLEVLRWLVEDCGAMVGLEDSDGETALHKACLSGRVEIAEYLVGTQGVEIEGTDNDGWTPLHNAASIGSLPIVSLLLSHGASLSPLSSHGFTPLMNAASKGHLPTVHLLLKRGADPLTRNRWGETAYDLAAGVFEVRCCEVLESYEKVAWRARRDKARREGKGQIEEYNPLGLHSTVPVVLYENQRLVTSTLSTFPTLAKNQKWTSKALSRNDRRAAFTLPRYVLESMTGGGEAQEEEGEERACFRSEIGLPVVGKENVLVVPGKREVRSGGRVRVTESAAGVSRSSTLKKKKQPPSQASNSLSTILASTSSSPPPSPAPVASTSSSRDTSPLAWVWLSSWTIDLSSPLSSPLDGWSYSQSFDTPNDEWKPSLPDQGTGNAKKWVRRRRWVRVMRRRVDLKDWGYLDSTTREEKGDYRAKAQAILEGLRGQQMASEEAEEDHPQDEPQDSPHLNRSKHEIILIERAAEELGTGIELDDDEDRKREAQGDLERLLERIALLKVNSSPTGEEGGGEESEEEFVYTGRDAGDDDDDDARSVWTTTRPSSIRTPSVSQSPDTSIQEYFSRTPTTSQHPDLTPQLAQNPEFRVPTDERASFFPTTSRSSSGQYAQHRTAWEPDEVANECRRCGTGFTFFKRKHHCRRCGLVCCANCTTHKDPIDPYLVVREPGIPPTLEDLQPWSLSTPLLYRTCDSCHAALALPQGLSSSHPASILSPQSFFPSSPSIGSVTPSETNESEASELSDCPCCGAHLANFGDRTKQEAHVRKCLEEGEGSISSGRYLVFNLPPGPLVGEDCGICFTEFEVNDRMARLVCLCTFHETCIRAWLSRGHTCPVHVPNDD
ncbi:uncharacterized protein JCM6883_006971 [Sporobolomyces salmoneus]|uniref:uncharacterized protein n=1 Tax=Sporobolomyces salmoneus TaxID=183962 RepID=UPI00317506B1